MNDNILKTVSTEFEKVRKEHYKMQGSFDAVNDQHEEMLSALKRVAKEHEIMTRDMVEIKELLKRLLAR